MADGSLHLVYVRHVFRGSVLQQSSSFIRRPVATQSGVAHGCHSHLHARSCGLVCHCDCLRNVGASVGEHLQAPRFSCKGGMDDGSTGWAGGLESLTVLKGPEIEGVDIAYVALIAAARVNRAGS